MTRKKLYITTAILTVGSLISIWVEYLLYDAIHFDKDTQLTYVTVQYKDYGRISDGDDMVIEHYKIYTTDNESYTIQYPTADCLFNGDLMQMDYGDTLRIGYLKAPNAILRFLQGEPVYSLEYKGVQMLEPECIYKQDETFNSIVLMSMPFLAIVWFGVNLKRVMIKEREEKSGRKRTVSAKKKKK